MNITPYNAVNDGSPIVPLQDSLCAFYQGAFFAQSNMLMFILKIGITLFIVDLIASGVRTAILYQWEQWKKRRN